MKKKTALITGITGMVGSHLLDFLVENTNWDIHGIVRWRSNLENIEHHLDKINKKKRIKLFYSDIRDALSVQSVFLKSKPDYIFHLAAQSLVYKSIINPRFNWETNVIGLLNLLESISKLKKKMLWNNRNK